MTYIAPKFTLVDKRMVEIPFVSTIGAGVHLTLLSSRIPYTFRIIQAKMIFTDDAANLVRHQWLTSSNASISTTGVPSGDNILTIESPTAYFIGRNVIRVINANIKITEINKYLKLYTFNGNAYAYNINCSMIIQEL